MDEENTLLILKKLNNMPVIFEEYETGVRIETTYNELKDGIYELNKQFAIVGAASINDLLQFFPSVTLPNDLTEKNIAAYGWCCECMYYADGPWIDYTLQYKENEPSVVELRFTPKPCDGFYDCQGTEEPCYQ